MPPAPDLLSTTVGTDQRRPSGWVAKRAVVSTGPPGGNGTMNVTAWPGQADAARTAGECGGAQPDDAAALRIEHGSLQSLVLVTGLAGATFIICRDTEIAATHFRKPLFVRTRSPLGGHFQRAPRKSDSYTPSGLPAGATAPAPPLQVADETLGEAGQVAAALAAQQAVAQRPRIVELEHVQRPAGCSARRRRAAPRRCRRRLAMRHGLEAATCTRWQIRLPRPLAMSSRKVWMALLG